jgi:hypothetical protein
MEFMPYFGGTGAAFNASLGLVPAAPPRSQDSSMFVGRRHKEWRDHEIVWRWLLDSLEGGARYRNAVYGTDRLGMPIMNLVRHKFEYPAPQEVNNNNQRWPVMGDPNAMYATDDSFNLRRARTPVPSHFRDAIGKHLSKIYAKDVERTGPDEIEAFWKDVDGKGTTIKDWIEQTFAPLLMALGQLDVLFDRPPNTSGTPNATEQDVYNKGMNRCQVSVILPENLVWWRLGLRDEYEEALVVEYRDDDEGNPVLYYRHWTKTYSQLYKSNGERDGGEVAHNYGSVPIKRIFDRKKERCRNVGQPRYEDVAENMREIYNRESELVLSDTQQVHAIVQGPASVAKAGEGKTVKLGPDWMLAKEKTETENGVHYEGYEILNFPKEGAESLRKNVQTLNDAVDKSTCQTKPAGVQGTGGTTVSQSGVSKSMDHRDGNLKLTELVGTLRRGEKEVVAGVYRCLHGTAPPEGYLEDEITIRYPMSFDLLTLDEIIAGSEAFQAFMAAAGEAPEAEIEIACKYIDELLPGLDPAATKKIDDEIRKRIEAKAEDLEARREAMPRGPAALVAAQLGQPGVPVPGQPPRPGLPVAGPKPPQAIAGPQPAAVAAPKPPPVKASA